MSVATDFLMWERWEEQYRGKKGFKRPNPECCGEPMEWYQSDQYGYYYRCGVCGKKKRRKYYHEFYTDSKGRTSVRLK